MDLSGLHHATADSATGRELAPAISLTLPCGTPHAEVAHQEALDSIHGSRKRRRTSPPGGLAGPATSHQTGGEKGEGGAPTRRWEIHVGAATRIWHGRGQTWKGAGVEEWRGAGRVESGMQRSRVDASEYLLDV